MIDCMISVNPFWAHILEQLTQFVPTLHAQSAVFVRVPSEGIMRILNSSR